VIAAHHRLGHGADHLFALMMALTVRVNAVKSEVRLADRQIEQLRRRRCCSTPSSRPAPASSSSPPSTMWTSVSGAQAGQYLENERQLAALGKPRSPDAPDPIRVASAASAGEGGAGDGRACHRQRQCAGRPVRPRTGSLSRSHKARRPQGEAE
jgi:hypothetical protein